MSLTRQVDRRGFSSEEQAPYDYRRRYGPASVDDLVDRLQRSAGQDGLIGQACHADPLNFDRAARQAAVIWLAFRLRERKARIVHAACRTYVRMRSSEPMIAPITEQMPFRFGVIVEQYRKTDDRP